MLECMIKLHVNIDFVRLFLGKLDDESETADEILLWCGVRWRTTPIFQFVSSRAPSFLKVSVAKRCCCLHDLSATQCAQKKKQATSAYFERSRDLLHEGVNMLAPAVQTRAV